MTRLEFIRRQRGYSQTRLAKRIDSHPTVLVQIEKHHRRSYPKIRKRLAEFFELEETVLFDSNGWAIEIESENVIEGLRKG